MKKIMVLLAAIGIISFGLIPAFGIIQVALADSSLECGARNGKWTPDPTGTTTVDGGTCTADTVTEESNITVNNLVKKIINILSWVVGVVSVIMIIIAGFKYVTSGGNDSSVASAKNTILYAIVGLVIVALAQVIVRFVLSNVSE